MGEGLLSGFDERSVNLIQVITGGSTFTNQIGAAATIATTISRNCIGNSPRSVLLFFRGELNTIVDLIVEFDSERVLESRLMSASTLYRIVEPRARTHDGDISGLVIAAF